MAIIGALWMNYFDDRGLHLGISGASYQMIVLLAWLRCIAQVRFWYLGEPSSSNPPDSMGDSHQPQRQRYSSQLVGCLGTPVWFAGLEILFFFDPIGSLSAVMHALAWRAPQLGRNNWITSTKTRCSRGLLKKWRWKQPTRRRDCKKRFWWISGF